MNNPKNIVITGTSSGIGYFTALNLCNKGHNIYAIARSKEKLQELKEESKNLKGNITIIPFDLAQFDKTILEKQLNNVPIIDILINNAGILLNKSFLEIQESEITEVLNVNYISVIKMIQYIHPKIKKSKIAHIVNIGSVGGVTGSVKFPGLSIYSSSKGALSILSECLAEEFKEDNVKVNCLALGSVNTNMLNKAFPDYTSQTQPKEMAEFIAQFSLNGANIINGTTQIVSNSNP
jgi:short-subunit dehydrogenase